MKRDVTSKLCGDASHRADFNALELARCVFPIVKVIDNDPPEYEFIGTGFFVSKFGLFATAKHVIKDAYTDDLEQIHPIYAIHILNKAEFILRPITRVVCKSMSDVALGLLATFQHQDTGEKLDNPFLKITKRIPTPNEEIVTFAYPNTSISEKVVMNTAPSIYDGRIVQYFPNGRDKVMMPNSCYETTIVIHGGASGGPVFTATGGVFGLSSTGIVDPQILPISYVSSIHNLLSLEFPAGCIPGLSNQVAVNLEEFNKYDFAKIVDN